MVKPGVRLLMSSENCAGLSDLEDYMITFKMQNFCEERVVDKLTD